MDEVLKPLKSNINFGSQIAKPHPIAAGFDQKQAASQIQAIKSPEEALEALKSKPGFDLLTHVLRWLDDTATSNDKFNIKVPGPKSAQILFILAANIVPDYWVILKDPAHAKYKKLLERCLGSISGISVLTARLRLLLGECETKDFDKKRSSSPIQDLLALLENLLREHNVIECLWIDTSKLIPNPSQQVLAWKEVVSLLAGGRLLSVVAEANRFLSEVSIEVGDGSWLGNGAIYSVWLGRNVVYMLMRSKPDNLGSFRALAQITSKAIILGYTEKFVETIYSSCVTEGEDLILRVSSLIKGLSNHDQKSLLYSFLRALSRQQTVSFKDNESILKNPQYDKVLSGNAALISILLNKSTVLTDALMDWLIVMSENIAGQDIFAHRVGIAVLSSDYGRMKVILNKALEILGDKLSIKHLPTIHQEVITQVFLIVAGCIYRADATYLSKLARSSLYLNAISNRLAASSQRASLLGMIVGTAISELVDPEGKKMNFKSLEVNSAEGKWYLNLTRLEDSIGSISDLNSASPLDKPVTEVEVPKVGRSHTSEDSISESKIIGIEEIDASSESEDENLPLYQKPDSDPSDSEDDPTLITRDKPVAPVYIRDLIGGLRDTEKFDRHRLALSTASQLIRRKASFGSEVSENIEELATLLVGLSDKYEMERFQEMRLQGMIAVLIALPLQMGQWFSRTFYNGDYSVGQRVSILTALSFGARELAGFAQEDASLTGADILPGQSFPSQKLPHKLHKIYAVEAASPMNALTNNLEKSMIQPMAVKAADKLTGPNALKVHTFSSRMVVEKKRSKPTPNALAKIVADGFFFPLTSRWRTHLQIHGSKSPHTGPTILPLFLKTLSLILHASGPSTLSLPALTADFWALLLSLRPRAHGDVSILEALLFGLLTLLEINAADQRRLADENAQFLLETREWVQGIFERTGAGLGEEEERVRMLCAGVLVRVGEVVEKWQRVMVGELGGFL